ncbi:MAG: MarR family transcriptional regulator [Herbinix sp.]|nr:MarR family transcriptional regulator [Herbinix sp.]
MGNNVKERCDLCKRHCPVDDLHCKKGRAYFKSTENKYEIELIASKEVTMGKHQKEQHKEYKEYKEHKEHKEHQGRHRGHGFVELEACQENELLALISKAGHFMHHKRGGKRGQEKILRILKDNEELSQKDVQKQLEIKSGSMSEIVIKMESKGYLDRIKDNADKRMTKLRLTELGREKLNEISQRSELGEAQLLQALSEEEQESLKALLSKLVTSWEEIFVTAKELKCGNDHCEDGKSGHGRHGHGNRKHGKHEHHDHN